VADGSNGRINASNGGSEASNGGSEASNEGSEASNECIDGLKRCVDEGHEQFLGVPRRMAFRVGLAEELPRNSEELESRVNVERSGARTRPTGAGSE
jgi:hypothetical protein